MFAPGSYVFVEHPPISTTAAKNCLKLCYDWLGPYVIVSVGLEVVIIIKAGIENTLSINRVVHTTELDGDPKENSKPNNNEESDVLDEQEPRLLIPEKNGLYAVNHIVHHRL